jgi:hypothetical protein
MDDHVIVFSNDQARFVLQRRRRTPNQIEQAVAPRRDVRAVLNQDYSRTLAHSISATGQSDTDVSNAARATMKLLARARTSCPAVSSLTTLTVFAKQQRKPKSLVAEAAITSFLTADDSDTREAAIAKRLDRLVRVLERLERNDVVTLETIGLFIRFWLTSTPALPEQSNPAARAKGAERYDRFVAALGRRLSSGSTILKEVSLESDAPAGAVRAKDELGSP